MEICCATNRNISRALSVASFLLWYFILGRCLLVKGSVAALSHLEQQGADHLL